MKTALVCIAKNEDNYIQEWIKYNFKLGFDHIFIYANDWEYKTNQDNVTVIDFPGQTVQTAAYNHFKNNLSSNYNWAAFFDIDEFLVLHRHNNIKEFLSDYKECNAIGINWAMFGNNNHIYINDENYSVLNRFTKKGTKNFIRNNVMSNKHIKSIVQLPCNKFQDIHCVSGHWYNTTKELRTGPFNEPIDWSVAQLNHYFTKSHQELYIKCKRGRADSVDLRNFEEYKIYLDLNDEIDEKAKNFMYG